MQIRVYYKHHSRIFLSTGLFFSIGGKLLYNVVLVAAAALTYIQISLHFCNSRLQAFSMKKYQTYRRMSKYLSSFHSALSDIR